MLIEYETIIRFVAAALVGLLIGFTRRHQAAGLRTFALICLGAAIFTIISIDPRVGAVEPTRVVGQIVTGIGFLGVGVIWKHDGKLSGLTTAAAIWVTAALGILVGMAFWFEVIIGTLLTVVVLYSKKTLRKARLEERDD